MLTELPSHEQELPKRLLSRTGGIESLSAEAAPFAEEDLFQRQQQVPGYTQAGLADTGILLAGAGGLNSWAALALVRSGAKNLTIIDPDSVEPSNLARQLFYAADVGQPKAARLVHNLAPHAIAGARLQGISMTFEEAMEKYALPCDLLVVGVDRNDCRLQASRLARRRCIPAVFTMLSADGLRCHCFLQRPYPTDACLWCALPNLDPEKALPCAASVITSCLMASAYTVSFVHRALMGWPAGVESFNFRDTDLLGRTPDVFSNIRRQPGCPVCGGGGK